MSFEKLFIIQSWTQKCELNTALNKQLVYKGCCNQNNNSWNYPEDIA